MCTKTTLAVRLVTRVTRVTRVDSPKTLCGSDSPRVRWSEGPRHFGPGSFLSRVILFPSQVTPGSLPPGNISNLDYFGSWSFHP